MLEKLTVQNIALIDRAEINFCAGLNVLSGETGAGKSVILDSIDFALGAKADKSMIRYGAEECSVRAEFRPEYTPRLREALQEAEIDEDELLVVSRRFSMDGKGSTRVNGCAVTAMMLRKITSCLVDVHGQSEHFYLLKEANQLRLLDKIAGEGVEKAKIAVYELLSKRKTLLAELEALGGDEGERNRCLDILKFQIEELERASLREGEEEELVLKRNKIANAERILEGIRGAVGALSADGSGVDSVRFAQRSLTSAAKYDEGLSALCERLENIYAELDDLAEEIASIADTFEFDNREADRVENRLDELKALKKKYGGSVEGAIAYLNDAREEMVRLIDSDALLERLQAELGEVETALYNACVCLTKERKQAAKLFAERVTEELKTLNIASARFEVQFSSYEKSDVSRANSEGLDGVKFLFSANLGEPLKELGKIISGGEMSRFMLAIKAQLSAEREIGTYVFDEIDAGISGKTARVVAEKFAKISKNTQIIAVSHLAQIASFADAQYVIEKAQSDGKTYTSVRGVEGEARIQELSRLLGGDEASESAKKHAEELLESANCYKKLL